MTKNNGLQFSAQATHHEGVVKELVTANPEEVAVGTDPNID